MNLVEVPVPHTPHATAPLPTDISGEERSKIGSSDNAVAWHIEKRVKGRWGWLAQTELPPFETRRPFFVTADHGYIPSALGTRKLVMLLFAALASALVSSPALATAPRSTGDAAVCNRACLDSFVDRYLDALVHHDPAGLPLAADVKISENNRIIRLGEGEWKSISQVNRRYSIRAADPSRGDVGYAGVVTTDGVNSMFSLRLKIRHGQIAEIEAILPGAALPPEFPAAASRLTTVRPLFAAPVAADDRIGRERLIAIANSYYEGIEQQDSHPVPFASDCHRIENGVALTNNPDYHYPYVASGGREPLPNIAALGCMDLANSGAFNADLVNARRFPIVDEERGLVFAFNLYQVMVKAPCATSERYGQICSKTAGGARYTLGMTEIFKITSGQIKAMESVWSIMPQTWRSVWW